MYIVIFGVSLFVLLKASDYFIDSAEAIGLSLGISPFVIGITIIAFGTSLPELATSISAVMAGESMIVMGNVVGSNVANILLVLGLTVVFAIRQIVIDKGILRLDIPILLLASFGLYYAVYDGQVSVYEAGFALVVLVFYLYRSMSQDQSAEKRIPVAPHVYGTFLMAGVFVFLGSKYTIYGIEGISTIAGISPDLIALSMVALGTSLPEVIVSVRAAKRGKAEIALGNVIGSNIFNILAVLGISRLFGALEITQSVTDFSLPLMLGVTVVLGLLCIYGRMKKWIGTLFLIMYALYIIYLSLEAL